MAERIRIVDIAKKAGVSAGTVDRVLHNRPNVSPKSRAKVEKVLKEQNYQPNIYASALAYNRSYHFFLLIPRHEQVAYWEEVEQGARTAIVTRQDFNIDLNIEYYDRFDNESFLDVAHKAIESEPDGMIIVPVEQEVTRQITDDLHAKDIPFVLLDSNMPDLKPLAFFGQDSLHSGYFAGRMLMLIAGKEKQILVMKITKNGRVVSKQQDNREVGFRKYMQEHYPNVEIITLELPFSGTKEEYDKIFNKFFAEHPGIHHAITLGSKAHILGEYLLKHKMKGVYIMGYDMVKKNAECLRKGSISFLIAQHAYQQGYSCVNALFRSVVLKVKVPQVNYMPIELLTKENVDFYRRTQL